jgi:haloalkane dehalogenase
MDEARDHRAILASLVSSTGRDLAARRLTRRELLGIVATATATVAMGMPGDVSAHSTLGSRASGTQVQNRGLGSAPAIEAQTPAKRFAEVLGLRMAYVEVGQGAPIVFLHGNPTSSYLWRNVIPHVAGLGRCIAPDLIGMGDSDKLPWSGPDSYTFVEHRQYLDGLFAALGVERDVTFVVHDWGSGLGFDWANRHRDAVKGIAYMEAIVRPRTWSNFSDESRAFFQAMRSPAGEALVLEQNAFVERLPGGMLRTLSDEEMEEYRRPFREPGEGRRPTLTWPRQLPIEGEPADVVAIVEAYGDWLRTSPVPKLFVSGDPGAILTGEQREFVRAWPNQTEVMVRGRHFLQEDSPDEIGQAVAEWYRRLG